MAKRSQGPKGEKPGVPYFKLVSTVLILVALFGYLSIRFPLKVSYGLGKIPYAIPSSLVWEIVGICLVLYVLNALIQPERWIRMLFYRLKMRAMARLGIESKKKAQGLSAAEERQVLRAALDRVEQDRGDVMSDARELKRQLSTLQEELKRVSRLIKRD